MAANQRDTSDPRPVEDVLTDLDCLLDELADVAGPDALDGDAGAGRRPATARLVEVSARLRVAGVRLEAVRWSVLPRIEAAGLWAQTGARTFAVWLARTEDVRTVTARAEVRTAKALRDHLPATLTKALAGQIGAEKVRALVDVATTSTARTDALATPAIDLPTTEPIVSGSVEEAPDDSATTGAPSDGSSSDGSALDGSALDGSASEGSVDPASGDAADPSHGVAAPTWEEQLLDWSTQNGPDRFRGLVRYFARHADPEADERGYSKAKDREYLDVSPTLGGYHVSGFLTEEHGLALTTALGSVMGAPTPGDDRSAGQRRAQALADLARVVLDNGHTGTGASVRPHLSVTVSWTELQTLATKNTTKDGAKDGEAYNRSRNTAAKTRTGRTGTNQTDTLFTGTTDTTGTGTAVADMVKTPAVFTETGTPVPASLLRRIACDSQVTRIVFGPDSQMLDVGRTQRTITGGLRRAVIARDKHCVLGKCDQPPSRCEVHHAETHWADGGHTTTANAALLCYHHHDLVDTHHITMHYENGWHFTDRHGQPIHTETDHAGR